MLTALLFRFPFPGPWGTGLARASQDPASDIADEQGLVWKLWLENHETGRAGGIYLFEDAAAAARYRQMHERRLVAAGLTDIVADAFSVNTELSVLTRGGDALAQARKVKPVASDIGDAPLRPDPRNQRNPIIFLTPITRAFGLTTPIVNAGMAMIARPALAAAVCEAGGLGTIACDINPPGVPREHVRQTKALTKRPFGVDLIGDFVTDEHLCVLIEAQVPLVIFFWTLPTPEQVGRFKAAGIQVWMQVGRVAEADEAASLGANALIVQGAEAGGHNRAEASTLTLFPRLRRLFPDLPLLSAGGIVDGATMAAALVLGADAVWCGSRFLASEEAVAHELYKARVLTADVGDTAILSIYGPEWPGHATRAIINEGGRAAVGREPEAIHCAGPNELFDLVGRHCCGSECLSDRSLEWVPAEHHPIRRQRRQFGWIDSTQPFDPETDGTVVVIEIMADADTVP